MSIKLHITHLRSHCATSFALKYECLEACKCVTLSVLSIECKSKYREKHRPKHTTYNIH